LADFQNCLPVITPAAQHLTGYTTNFQCGSV